MPRPNRPRSIHGETHLAERIAYERTRRGLSYETLADLMTDAGCPIVGSAIYRIEKNGEKGTPARKISVDELIALAIVFETDIVQLLEPVALIEQVRGREIAQQLVDKPRQVQLLLAELFGLYVELHRLARESPELAEYVRHQEEAIAGGPPLTRLTPDEIGVKVLRSELDHLQYQLITGALRDIARFAREVARADD